MERDRLAGVPAANALALHYADSAQVAAYLEAEWSDFLLSAPDVTAAPARFGPVAPTFYAAVAANIVQWTALAGLQVRTACDVGGATGRLAYELARRRAALESVTLVEPAPQLARWARQLLLRDGVVDSFPTVGTRQRTGLRRPAALPDKITGVHIAVVEQELAALAEPLQCDLVCCLNVVDRVARPSDLVAALAAHVRTGGMLVLASPLSFDVRFTPDRGDWIEDLRTLLPDQGWRIAGHADLLYEIRRHTRERISYLSQTVAAIKR